MKRLALVLGVLALVATSTGLWAQGVKRINELLTGYEEAPLALSTTGGGEFNAKINKEQTQIDWELSYDNLEGTITQAHIHFGQIGIAGGISVFLCSNLGNGPVGTQPCPAQPATISGTIVAADVIGPAAQGIGAGQFDELLAAIRAGSTYVNVHTTLYGSGEIRAQIKGHGRGAGAPAPAHNH